MLYHHDGSSIPRLGHYGSSCSCSSCKTSSRLSEYYYEGEGRDPPRRPGTSLHGFSEAACAFAFKDATRIEHAAARDTLHLSAAVAGNFLRNIGALSARGRFIPTIIDNKYWFAKLYQYITFEEVSSVSQFRQPAFVMHFIPIFYGMYHDAMTQWLKNNRAAVPPLWAIHFTRSARPDNSSIADWAAGLRTSIVTAATAHIRGDMATAVERTYRSYVARYCLAPAPPLDDFRPDFFESNRIMFDRAKASLLLEASRFSPLPVRPEIGQFLFAKGEPLAGGLSVDDVYRWRELAWAEARRRLGQ
jgi:hypothetical protein